MKYLLVILRGCLLILSCYGYLQYFSKKIRIEFSLSLLFSGIGLIMFLSGLLNILVEMSVLLLIVGLYLTYKSVKNKDCILALLTPGTLFFVLMSVFLLFVIYGSKFVQYDNFSHWGTAARIIAKYDKFPTMANENFDFTSYPLGTSSLIYYITNIIGIYPEWLQSYVQAVMMVSMLSCLFPFGDRLISILLAVWCSILLLIANIPLNSLYVDTVLPLVALSGMLFCIYYRNELKNMLKYIFIYTAFLISIKNSGLLFAGLIYLYVFYVLLKSKADLKPLYLSLFGLALILFRWQKHVDLVFTNGMMGRHSMSLSYFQSIVNGKTWGDILKTIQALLKETFSFSNPAVYVLLFGVLLLLFLKYAAKSDSKNTKEILTFAAVSYGIYQVGLLGMYIFNMPADEHVLSSYDRYHMSIVIFICGLICTCMICEITKIDYSVFSVLRNTVLPLALGFCILITITPDFSFYSRQKIEGTERYKFDSLISGYGIDPNEEYIILVGPNRQDSGYLSYMTRYLLDPQKHMIGSIPKHEEEIVMALEDFDYIIIFEETEENRDFVVNHFGEEISPVIDLGNY